MCAVDYTVSLCMRMFCCCCSHSITHSSYSSIYKINMLTMTVRNKAHIPEFFFTFICWLLWWLVLKYSKARILAMALQQTTHWPVHNYSSVAHSQNVWLLWSSPGIKMFWIGLLSWDTPHTPQTVYKIMLMFKSCKLLHAWFLYFCSELTFTLPMDYLSNTAMII